MMNIYVANLGKYNEGFLVGDWINLPCTEEELNNLFVKIGLGQIIDGEYVHGVEINGVVYEEHAIHDYECDVKGVDINEYSDINELNEIAEQLENLSDYEEKVMETLMDDMGYTFDDALEKKDDCLTVELDNMYNQNEDLGINYVYQIFGGVEGLDKKTLEQYFDYEAFGRDLGFDFTFSSEHNIAICDN